jgi:RNA polymerase sigma-70 factor (ECF subfamily)
MASSDEKDLIERFKKGDPSAFEAIVLRHQDRIYNLCRYMLRDPQNARDAAQDVFLKAYRGLKDFRPDSSLYTWMYRIAVTTCLDYRKRFRREVLTRGSVTGDLPSGERSPHDIYESTKITESIRLALQKLPEKPRVVILLREIEGLSYDEIAEVLHISVGTVKSRISRARDQLRHLLKELYVTLK